MDAIWLPVTDTKDRLFDAIVAMHESKRSGLLVEGDREYRIIHAGGVLAAPDRGERTLGDVESTDVVHLANPKEAVRFKVDLVRPVRTERQFEALLDSVHAEYSVIAHASELASIVTRHESLREMLSLPNTYYCLASTNGQALPVAERVF